MTDPAIQKAIEEAIEQVKGGRVDAYETVVGAYQARLRAVVASACPPGIDADEIAHRAFIEAFKKIDNYAPNTRFFAWLAAIARTLVLLEMRRVRNDARKHHGYAEALISGAIEAELEAEAGLDEGRVRSLRDCLGRLPDPLRSVLEMRYTEGASLGHIADAIGKTVGAVKFQLFFARKKVRDCMTRRPLVQES